MLDAYAIRKAIPKIFLAVIGINLSIYVCVAALDITVIISRGIDQLITSPFVGNNSIQVDTTKIDGNPLLGGTFLAAIVLALFKIGSVTGGALSGAIGGFILIIVLITLAVLFTLIIRQGLIIFLTITAPVAFACSILPGTEKYFKKWFDLFTKTLMVYPIIAAIFAMSHVMAAILLNDATSGGVGSLNNLASINSGATHLAATISSGDTNQTIKYLAAILVIYAPLVLIPFAFKLAGGAIGGVMNAFNSSTSRMRDNISRNRNEDWRKGKAEAKERNRGGHRFKGGTENNLRGRVNRGLQRASIVKSGSAGVNPTRMAARLRSATGDVELEAAKKAKESVSGSQVLVQDTLMNALLHGDKSEASSRQYLKEKGQTGRALEDNVAKIRTFKREVGARTAEIASTMHNPATKTTFTGEQGDIEMIESALKASNGDDNLFGAIYNEQRNNANAGGRFDLGGNGFGTGINAGMALKAALANGDQSLIDRTKAEWSEKLTEDSLTHLTGGQVMGGHGNSAARLLNHANKRVDKAAKRVTDAKSNQAAVRAPGTAGSVYPDAAVVAADKEVADAERNFKQVFGLSANLLDMANAVGAENATMNANTHMDHIVDVGSKQLRVSEIVESLKPDPVFQQNRRELASYGTPEQIAAAKKAGAAFRPPTEGFTTPHLGPPTSGVTG